MFKGNPIPVWIGIILLSGMFLMGQGAECPWTEMVDFPDPALEDLIRDYMSKPEGPICTSELATILTIRETTGLGIEDLSGLEFCTNLMMLFMPNNLISDISPLAGLTLLWTLALNDNEISDLSPLVGLTDLVNLYLDENQISDLTPLAGLTELHVLYLDGNQISDLSPLAGLTELHVLYLEENQISDILPLLNNSGIHSGDEVHLEGNPLSSTSCNVHISALESRGVDVYHDCP